MAEDAQIHGKSDAEGAQRAEFFSDGILAISITLLVIEIRVPQIPQVPSPLLGAALARLWPSYLAYVLSFATIGLVWIAHHQMFRLIGTVNRSLLMLNLVLLLGVAFLPFSTAVLSRYASSARSGAIVATELYSINMLFIGVMFLGLWVYLYYRPSLLIDGADRGRLIGSIKRSTVVPIAYGLSAILATVSTTVCFVIWVLTTLFIATRPSARSLFARRPLTSDTSPLE